MLRRAPLEFCLSGLLVFSAITSACSGGASENSDRGGRPTGVSPSGAASGSSAGASSGGTTSATGTTAPDAGSGDAIDASTIGATPTETTDDAAAGTTTGSTGPSTGDPVRIIDSNTPGAKVEETADEGLRLRLVSSNLLIEQLDADYNYHQWFAEVTNEGPFPICDVTAVLVVLDSHDGVRTNIKVYSTAPPHLIAPGSVPSAACIPPASRGILWGNYIGTLVMSLSDVHTMRISYHGEEIPNAVPHPLAPTFSTPTLGTSPKGQTIASSIVAKERLRSVTVEAFGLNAKGLVAGQTLIASNDLVPGEAFNYEGTFYGEPDGMVRAVQQALFIPVAEPAGASALSDVGALSTESALHASRARSVWADAREAVLRRSAVARR